METVQTKPKFLRNLTDACAVNPLRDWFLWTIGPLVALSRWMTLSQPYFADGPGMIQVALDHTYVIQPPGYWLYCRIAGAFPDPAIALGGMNVIASGLGAMVFYLVCLCVVSQWTARLAVLAYSSVFYAWFAGSVQSSYGGELLFPPLMLLFMLLYMKRNTLWPLFGIAISYALVGGVRPSDGAFLAPALLYFGVKFVPRTLDRLLLFGVCGAFCLCWYIPQQIALAHSSGLNNVTQLLPLARESAPIFLGLQPAALSNIFRVVIPLGLAFWSLVPALFLRSRNPIRTLLWIWIGPGLTFFTFVYISDAPYLCFLTSALIVLALLPGPNRVTHAGLIACVVFNLVFFLFSRPIEDTRSLPVMIYDVNGPRYCSWALQHRWYKRLRDFTDVPYLGNHAPPSN